MYKNVRQKVKNKNRSSYREREENESFLTKEKKKNETKYGKNHILEFHYDESNKEKNSN